MVAFFLSENNGSSLHKHTTSLSKTFKGEDKIGVIPPLGHFPQNYDESVMLRLTREL